MAEGFDERVVGSQRLLVAASEQNRGAVRVCRATELGGQPRLADARLADQRDDAPSAGASLLPAPAKLV
jgi:hypothetical protein